MEVDRVSVEESEEDGRRESEWVEMMMDMKEKEWKRRKEDTSSIGESESEGR